MSTPVAPTNGAAKKQTETPNKNASTGTKPNNDAKTTPLLPAPVIPIDKNKSELPSLDDRFVKMDTLFSLRERYEKLKDSLDKLNKFKLSSEGRSDSITLKDATGNTFTTHNPEVLAKVVEWLKDDLTAKIKTVAPLHCITFRTKERSKENNKD